MLTYDYVRPSREIGKRQKQEVYYKEKVERNDKPTGIALTRRIKNTYYKIANK